MKVIPSRIILTLILVGTLALTSDIQSVKVICLHTCYQNGESPSGLLYVIGTKLYDASGKEVFLRSINVHRNERREENGRFWTVNDIERIKESGGNCIELSLELVHDWMPGRDQINETYFVHWLDKEVAWCEEHQIYYIITLRQFASVYNWMREEPYLPDWLWEGLYPYSKPLTQEEATEIVLDFMDTDNSKQEQNRQAWINAWKFVANRYKDNEYALFGLMNEPYVWTPTITDENLRTHLNECYTDLVEMTIDAIRSVGARQVIFVDYPRLGDEGYTVDHVNKITKDNTVWETHIYITSSVDLEEFNRRLDIYVHKFVYEFQQPLFIGEYGMKNPIKPDNWQHVLVEQMANLDSKPTCGRQWNEWGLLDGEQIDVLVSDFFDAQESEWIVQTVLTKMRTDLNSDNIVNILDMAIVAIAYGSRPGEDRWNPTADLNKDEVINIIDLAIVAKDWGKTA